MHKQLRNVAALDLFLNGMCVFLILVGVMFPFLNPPTSESIADPPGNMNVFIDWDEGNLDVDLWVHGPGEPKPIGYSNKGGVYFNLVRDDLGNSPDATKLNFENAYSRGLLAGEYTFNVHCFRCPTLPVKVNLVVEISHDSESGKKQKATKIFTKKVDLVSDRQEITVVNFMLDADGRVDRKSVNFVHKKLREASAYQSNQYQPPSGR